MRDRDYKDTHYEVKNLTLEEDAKFLIVPTYGFNDNEKEPIIDKICSLENVVAQGESEITGYVHFDMFNSVVSNFRCGFSRESYRTNLSNSIFSGECNMSGVKSIDTSIVPTIAEPRENQTKMQGLPIQKRLKFFKKSSLDRYNYYKNR